MAGGVFVLSFWNHQAKVRWKTSNFEVTIYNRMWAHLSACARSGRPHLSCFSSEGRMWVEWWHKPQETGSPKQWWPPWLLQTHSRKYHGNTASLELLPGGLPPPPPPSHPSSHGYSLSESLYLKPLLQSDACSDHLTQKSVSQDKWVPVSLGAACRLVFPPVVGWTTGGLVDRDRPLSAFALACRVVAGRAADPRGTVEAFKT